MPRVSDKRKLINGYWKGQQARNEQEKLNHTAEVIRDSVESVEQGWEEVVEELEETMVELGEVLAEEEMNPESDSSDWSSNSIIIRDLELILTYQQLRNAQFS
ncbi:hypothetical protein BDZ91DRAFT_847760 [Kalaharituber pfeilii]|nr:hypothetical protein BDZ91DRAFT_847760 [Kalaharituber pfeilii]